MDTIIYKIQKVSLAVNHFHKKLEEDFKRNLKYSDLTTENVK